MIFFSPQIARITRMSFPLDANLGSLFHRLGRHATQVSNGSKSDLNNKLLNTWHSKAAKPFAWESVKYQKKLMTRGRASV